jgi:hypothetical protein
MTTFDTSTMHTFRMGNMTSQPLVDTMRYAYFHAALDLSGMRMLKAWCKPKSIPGP